MSWYVSQEIYNLIAFTALFIFIAWISILADEYYRKKYGKSLLEDPELEGDVDDRDQD